MKIEYRKADIADAELLVGIYNSAFYDDYVKYGECPAYGKTKEMMEKSIIDFPKFIIVGILPEYGVAGIKDRSHADEFQGMGVLKNAEIVQMPVRIGQNLIFQEEGNVCFVIQQPILDCATAYSRRLCSKRTIHMTPIVLLG